MAVNWRVVPSAMVESAGLTSMAVRIADVTVRPVEPETLPRVAVMVVEPRLTAVARPWEPPAFDIVATEVVVEDHVTCAVTSCTVLSL